MIDMRREHLITVSQAPHHLPARSNGKVVHWSAIYRWIASGIRGVTLESLKVGGTTYTSVEALERFAKSLTTASLAPRSNGGLSGSRIDRATRIVRHKLGLDRS